MGKVGETCGTHAGGERCVALVGRPEGKRPLERPKPRWEDNIKMDFREIRIDGTNWIQLAQDVDLWRIFMSMIMRLRAP
jgi:hypothetical protein